MASHVCRLGQTDDRVSGTLLALAPPSRPHTPSLDDIDVTRHREITSKAVSAILLLTLKWFKVSRECAEQLCHLVRA